MYVWNWLCLWCKKHGIAVDLGNSDVKHLGSATRYSVMLRPITPTKQECNNLTPWMKECVLRTA
jgi:hypothetical protein